MFTVSDAWKAAYPDAGVGILVMHDVLNPGQHPALDERKRTLETELRSRYSGYDRSAIKAIPTILAYNAYYKRFKKTYHVQLQLESVLLKDKSIPRAGALVEAMFMAELEDMLLTAGHDLKAVQMPVGVYVADGSERYTRLNGQEQELKPGDMFISDAQGIMSSIIYGPGPSYPDYARDPARDLYGLRGAWCGETVIAPAPGAHPDERPAVRSGCSGSVTGGIRRHLGI